MNYFRGCFCLLFLVALLPGGCGQAPALQTAHGKPVRHWVEALQSPDVKVRLRAVRTLGNVGTGDPAAVPALIGAVKDRDAGVRGAAIQALGRMGPDARSAVPALREARKDADPTVRSQAGEALVRAQAEK
jgi:hypothetical protein